MSTLDAIREVGIVLTVERFDQVVQFYREHLGLTPDVSIRGRG